MVRFYCPGEKLSDTDNIKSTMNKRLEILGYNKADIRLCWAPVMKIVWPFRIKLGLEKSCLIKEE